MKVLEQLRSELSERFPQATQVQWRRESGDKVFWAWPKGGLRELVAAPGFGASLLLQRWLKLGQGIKALLDAADGFDPDSCDAELLPELLWLRCNAAAQAMRAADVLMREGCVPVLAMDFRLCEPRELRAIPSSSWHRLRLLASRSGVSVLVCSPFAWLPCVESRWQLGDAALALSELQQGRAGMLEQKLMPALRVA